jgi:8-oxo-dGTP pyrophosphatase MutT (NUDIX family)
MGDGVTASITRWQREPDFATEDFGIFTVGRHRAVSPRTGVTGTYVTIASPDWINMIAVTHEGEVVLVRQYRHGVDDITLEIPSGIVDPGETELAAAQRELREETGYTAERWQYLGSVHPNPAFQGNRCHSFLAAQCRRTAEPELDAGEDIEVVALPLWQVGRLLQDGGIDHALAIAAFFRYIQEGQPEGPLF